LISLKEVVVSFRHSEIIARASNKTKILQDNKTANKINMAGITWWPSLIFPPFHCPAGKQKTCFTIQAGTFNKTFNVLCEIQQNLPL
jgi:hypothetical protein